MKTDALLALVLLLFIYSSCQEPTPSGSTISKAQAIEDLAYLDKLLEEKSSYQRLNGYDYKADLDQFRNSLPDQVERLDLGIFLTKLIANIGDRHSSIRGYDLEGDKYLPFMVAPLDNKVLVLDVNREEERYVIYNPRFPYLKAINGIPILRFLEGIAAEEKMAPKEALVTRAVRQLKNMEENYRMLEEEMPELFEFTLTNGTGNDTLMVMPLETDKRKFRVWWYKFPYRKLEGEELNDTMVAQSYFKLLDDNIAYLGIPDMAAPEEAPIYYEVLNQFMGQIKDTEAAIIDIRNNDGGTRHLIWELANYFVHPDSVHIVNVAHLRSDGPLNEDQIGDLHSRSLYAYDELDDREKKAVDQFMAGFKPMYTLPQGKYSEPYFTVINGAKLSLNKYYYDKPIYILMNERVFSAGGILAAVFKGVPNIQLAGVCTDGSSGNSEIEQLPNSGLRVKLSTMVSFQKDGRILDGYGTEPDIRIARNLGQILYEEDYQLEELKRVVRGRLGAE